jgi:glycosyltransferase involved in cell wall biosynthesis
VERIAWLAAGYEEGGIARSVLSVERAFRENGHLLGVVSLGSGFVVDLAERNRIRVAVSRPPVFGIDRLVRKVSPRSTTGLTIALAGISSYVERLSESSIECIGGLPSVVHVRSPHLLRLGGALAEKLEARLVWQIPNYLGGAPNRRPVREAFYRKLVESSKAHPLANSRRIAEEFAFLGTVPWAYIPIEPQFFAAQVSRPYPVVPHFLSMGSVSDSKGQLVLVDAFEEYVVRGGRGRLTFVGLRARHRPSEALRTRVRISQARDRIALKDFTSDPLGELLAADVAVCGNRPVEAFGQVAAQAIAVGMPVLAIGQGGPRELVSTTRFGWLVPEFLAPLVADGLLNVDSSLADMLQRAGDAREAAKSLLSYEEFVRIYLGLGAR